MQSQTNQKDPYRWLVLFAYSLLTATICLQWLSFAPIAREAQEFYHTSAFAIDFLALVYLVLYLFLALPASYFIDRYGIQKGLGIGAILTAFFGTAKGLGSDSYALVCCAQVGLGIAQPFLLNAVTKLSFQWFPLEERASAIALGTLAQFIGIITAMLVGPYSFQVNLLFPGIKGLLSLYAFLSIISAILSLLVIREKPKHSTAAHGEDREIPFREGIKHLRKVKDFKFVLLLFLIGLGVFNAISTCIDQIGQAKGFDIEQSGLLGGSILVSGIIGAICIPPFSDRFQKRKIFLIISMIGFVLGLGIFVIYDSFPTLVLASVLIGFFLLGIGAPIGFLYAAEISSPAPESTSQGLLLLAGQISGIIFILGLHLFGMIQFSYVLFGLACLTIILVLRLRESPWMAKG